MTDAYLFGENEVGRTARAVREDEAARPEGEQNNTDPAANRQLRVFHKLPAETANVADVHVAMVTDGFDFTDLHNPCSDGDLVEVRTTDALTFTANETAFFEGTLFEQEIAIGLSLEGKIYLLGGNHISVTGTKVTDSSGGLFIELDDCPSKQVPFEWLTAPAEDIPDGTPIIALYVKAKNKYVAVVVSCEDEA